MMAQKPSKPGSDVVARVDDTNVIIQFGSACTLDEMQAVEDLLNRLSGVEVAPLQGRTLTCVVACVYNNKSRREEFMEGAVRRLLREARKVLGTHRASGAPKRSQPPRPVNAPPFVRGKVRRVA